MYEVFHECAINCNMSKTHNLIYTNTYSKASFFLNHIYFDLWVIGVIREVWCFDIKMK